MTGMRTYSVRMAVLIGLAGVCQAGMEPSPGKVVRALADHLVGQQVSSGPLKGAWVGEDVYTGTIVAGLVCAYEVTCEQAYRQAAESGAEFFIAAAEGNFYGDEAYALTVLSETCGEGSPDRWFLAVAEFYEQVRTRASGSTNGYISQFDRTELSATVFYLASHTVAAYHVDATDKQLWRQALIRSLAKVNDATAAFPVLALGVATWALAISGPLDETGIASWGGVACWQQKRLSDLPDVLMEHQVAADQPLPGSFYWRFDHGDGGTGGPVSGYTEDLVFGAMGLVAAARTSDSVRLEKAITAANAMLMESLEGAHAARQHCLPTSQARSVYTAEALQALAALRRPGDINSDGKVNTVDFSLLASHWRQVRCSTGCRCDRTDINRDGQVDYRDLLFVGQGGWGWAQKDRTQGLVHVSTVH